MALLSRQQSFKSHLRGLTLLIPVSAFLYNSWLLINLLHYSTLPSLKIWSWPRTWMAAAADSESGGSGQWFNPEVALQVLSLLSCLYFFTAVLVSIVGIIGVYKKQPAAIRFYRDCAIADLSFSMALTLIMGYVAFFYQQLNVGVTVCEELTRHPVVMRSLSIDTENCEQWTERWVFAGIILMLINVVIRLHAILFISKFYRHVMDLHAARQLPLSMSDLRRSMDSDKPSSLSDRRARHHRRESSTKKIFLTMPSTTPTGIPSSSQCPTPTSASTLGMDDDAQITVYSPSTMTVKEARRISGGLKEAWVGGSRKHHHRNHRHHRKSSEVKDTWVDSAEEDEGAIALPVYPMEGLLPDRT